MTKFYNLPPSWNPGYADPESVREEGLQRRAFVTAMTRRGTYDDPKVGSGGYALPNYIKKEHYGQGAYYTKWEPRGTYDGPVVPNYLDRQPRVVSERPIRGGGAAVTFSGLGDVASSPGAGGRFQRFGAEAAARIIRSVMRLPPSERRAAIKRALDAMDPSLFSKAERYAKELTQKGVPAQKALPVALARAITEGMLAELERSGKTRTAPQANSLPGLGCYRAMSALGAVERVATTQVAMTPAGTCAPPAGYTWDVANGQPFLRRLKAGETPKQGPCGGQVSQSEPTTKIETGEAREGEMLEIGPSSSRVWFTIPVAGGRLRFTQLTRAQLDARGVSASQRELLGMSLSADAWADIQAQVLKQSSEVNKLRSFMSVNLIDGTPMGIPGKVADVVVNGKFPLYSFAWPGEGPIKGKRTGLYIRFVGASGGLPQWEMQFRIAKETDPVVAAFSWVKSLFAKIVNVVKEVVNEVADLACELVNSPGAAGAAAGAAATPSGPSAAAAAGVVIASSMCGGKNQAPPPPLIGGGSSGTILLLGAGALVVVALAKRKKRKSP